MNLRMGNRGVFVNNDVLIGVPPKVGALATDKAVDSDVALLERYTLRERLFFRLRDCFWAGVSLTHVDRCVLG